MKYPAAMLVLTLSFNGAAAQHQHDTAAGSKPAVLIEGLGEVHHPVTTKNSEAQHFFNQGLALVYAFNHDEATRAFRRAAELDPQLAMAYWGIALALGPNINMDIDAKRERLAFEAVQMALSLAPKASEAEQAYIKTLATRYSGNSKPDRKQLNVDYKNAMAELVKRYPDDLDAATLYAESIMDLRPWQFWSSDGKPAEGTDELVTVLESVLKRNPNHLGANHYYIHAVEASNHPEWALPSAQRLKALAPAAGHLVHMPAHIDMRVGNYEAAARSNAYAAAADEEYFKSHEKQGMYPVMYYSHNLHFLAVAHSTQGRHEDAVRAARRLEAHLVGFLKDGPDQAAILPMLDSFMPTQNLIQVRFRRWDEILKSSAPDRRLPAATALWRFARGLAYANAADLSKAQHERKLMAETVASIPADAMFAINKAHDIMKIAGGLLDARIAWAGGNRTGAIEELRKAAAVEDQLNYDEPPDWHIPVRESLGGALLLNGQLAEAERVFRADLAKNPRSGRSLFGLMKSLEAQGKKADAQFVKMEFETAWKNADTQLRVEDL